MYSDQIGWFPVTSRKWNKYLMIAVEMNGNYINVQPLRSRMTNDLTQAYQAIFKCWKATKVICTHWHILDNEAPEDFKQAICQNGCRIELTPANMHCFNTSERAIQTYKEHFIGMLAGVSNDFQFINGTN